MTNARGWIDRLRQPEYTGENRCTPCTALNVALAAAAGGVLGVLSPPLGVVVFGVSLVAIYFRGYLVPYTPEITKRYFPDRVLRWFDKETSAGTADSPEAVEDIDVEQTLYALDVITECDHVDDLCLDPSFERAWEDRIDDLRRTGSRTEDIRRLLDLDPGDSHEIEERGTNAALVIIDGTVVGQWESDAALVADLAADAVLRERCDDWQAYHVINRSRLLNSLRMFLETCAECGAPVSVDQETVESCCRSFDVVGVSCDDCGSRLFEIELTDEMKQQL